MNEPARPERPGRAYPERPFVGVLALVMRGERVLIVQRAHAPNAGRWGLPGGVLELGETVAQGAMRELREETGVAATPAGVLTVLDALDRDSDGRTRHHYVLVVVQGIWQAGEGVAADDAAAVAWLTRAEIVARDLPVLPALLPLLDRALAEPICPGHPRDPAAYDCRG